MAPAIIGLAGAMLGALATLLGTALSERRQARREDRKWRRDQRTAAYDGALRHLLRAANLRSEFVDGRGAAILKQEHQREWFDDLVEGQFWLHAATHHCDAAQLGRLTETAELLDTYVARLNSGENYEEKGFSILQVLQTCIDTVSDCARRDGAGLQPGLTKRTAVTAASPRTRGEPHPPWTDDGSITNIPMGNVSGHVVGGDYTITFGGRTLKRDSDTPRGDAES
jgi:hypothetical protein